LIKVGPITIVVISDGVPFVLKSSSGITQESLSNAKERGTQKAPLNSYDFQIST
jgi:hypothetical protein